MLLGSALLISLLITEPAPRLRFDASLMAPPRAKRNFIPIRQPEAPRRTVKVNLKPRPSGFFAPVVVPRETLILDRPQETEPEAPSDMERGFLPPHGAGPLARYHLLGLDPDGREIQATPPPPAVPQPPAHPAAPLRVGGDVASAKLIHRVQPLYPPLAIQARIQGVVRLEAVIDEDGEILNLRVISGHPMLIQPSLQAVGQWRYQPTLLNGRPVAVITTVEVNFRLGGN